jgi:hypothetical protein
MEITFGLFKSSRLSLHYSPNNKTYQSPELSIGIIKRGGFTEAFGSRSFIASPYDDSKPSRYLSEHICHHERRS